MRPQPISVPRLSVLVQNLFVTLFLHFLTLFKTLVLHFKTTFFGILFHQQRQLLVKTGMHRRPWIKPCLRPQPISAPRLRFRIDIVRFPCHHCTSVNYHSSTQSFCYLGSGQWERGWSEKPQNQYKDLPLATAPRSFLNNFEFMETNSQLLQRCHNGFGISSSLQHRQWALSWTLFHFLNFLILLLGGFQRKLGCWKIGTEVNIIFQSWGKVTIGSLN